MKRLLAAGYPRIFQICKCYRRGERGGRHLPELTMLEWYAAGRTYRQLMTDCEAARLVDAAAIRATREQHVVHSCHAVYRRKRLVEANFAANSTHATRAFAAIDDLKPKQRDRGIQC